MADTDDDQTVELEPEQHLRGDDDTEAASERRAASPREREDEERTAAVVGLTPEEAAARREEERDERLAEELDQDHADELDEDHEKAMDLAALDERQLAELRRRRELLAAADTTEALRLSEAGRELRRDGDAKTRQAMSDWAHGHHQLDKAALRPDEPGADALAADGRRYQRAAVREDRSAESDYQLADQYDDAARERRDAARDDLPPAREAVLNRPTEPPEASKYVHKNLKKVRKVRDRSTQPDLGLGD